VILWYKIYEVGDLTGNYYKYNKTMKNLIKRKPEIVLPLSIRFAKEYLTELNKMQNNIENVQESKKLTIIRRAIWTSLIIEVAKIFDTHNDTISYKKLGHLKEKINKHHSEDIIGKIIETRKTFTAHFASTAKEVTMPSEICKSKLGKILDDLESLSIAVKVKI
jgi:hypothetical protein